MARDDGYYLKLAKEAFSQSTSYFDSNYRSRIDDAIRMFHSQHPRSSKYNSDAYRYRSRLFRPKSRSVVRKHEATAARAFFSNLDVVSVSPQDGADPKQSASAIINKELLQYRLTKTIPWFITLIGAFQDAMKTGMVASFQYWEYDSRQIEEEVDAQDPATGETVKVKQMVEEVYKDQPCVELIPIERLRFSPNAKWYNVVETSPYVILEIPMFVYQVKARIDSNNYGPKWRPVTDAELRAALVQEEQSTENARRSGAQAPSGQSNPPLSEYDVVAVHLNFMDTDEGRVVYYTLQDRKMLSDPVPIEEMFFHGKMPITVGFCVMDTHNPAPDGIIDLGKMLQTETNEIANQRIDNVKLVLNKRWLVKRNTNVDTDSLMRNVPGGVTMVSNTASDGGDIREVNWQDVTSSSYQEQDRINVDYDDLTGGGINSASVMSNRRLNETVGGMKIMAQGANDLTEYTIRTFVETWVEPVLRQLMLLEQYYESDETILAIAGKKAGLYQKFGTDQMTDDLLINELTLTVNVGMGATDPTDRLQKYLMANNSWLQMSPMLPPDANPEEIRTELFGLAGYRDSSRFYSGQVDPRIAPMQQQMQAMGQQTQELMKQIQIMTVQQYDKEQERVSKEKIADKNNVTKLLVAQSGGENPDIQRYEIDAKNQREDERLQHEKDMDMQRLMKEAMVEAIRLNMEKQDRAHQQRLADEKADHEKMLKQYSTMSTVKQKGDAAKQKHEADGEEEKPAKEQAPDYGPLKEILGTFAKGHEAQLKLAEGIGKMADSMGKPKTITLPGGRSAKVE